MKKIRFIFTILIATLFLIMGCGGGSSDPTTPDDELYSYHMLLGVWTITFDLEKIEAELEKNETLIPAQNISMWLPTPKVIINSYNSETNVIDFDMEVSNPYPGDAFDPRIIIYANNDGCLLLNSDQWTYLYAHTGGWFVNPFKALAEGEPERRFAAKATQTANLRILLPNTGPTVNFSLEASYPRNCREPYMFKNFRYSVINPQFRSNSFVEVEIYDWQNDVTSVYLRIPDITDYPYSTFQRVIDNTWGVYLINKTSAPAGDYKGLLIGFSENSQKLVLCDIVTVTIQPDTIPPKWVSTVGITDVVAGDSEATVYWNMAVDPPNPPPIYYLLYMDTDDYPWDQTPIVKFWHNPFMFTGLTNGITYYFGIRSMDSADPPNIDQNNIVMTAIPNPH